MNENIEKNENEEIENNNVNNEEKVAETVETKEEVKEVKEEKKEENVEVEEPTEEKNEADETAAVVESQADKVDYVAKAKEMLFSGIKFFKTAIKNPMEASSIINNDFTQMEKMGAIISFITIYVIMIIITTMRAFAGFPVPGSFYARVIFGFMVPVAGVYVAYSITSAITKKKFNPWNIGILTSLSILPFLLFIATIFILGISVPTLSQILLLYLVIVAHQVIYASLKNEYELDNNKLFYTAPLFIIFNLFFVYQVFAGLLRR